MDDELQTALSLHQAGDVDQAIAIYRRLIDSQPDNADAWHLLGVALHQKGDHKLAAELLEMAIALRGDVADYHSNLGMVQLALDAPDISVAAFEAALAIQPDHAKALSNLAGLRRAAGDFGDAVGLAGRAVAADPDDPEVQVNLGNILKDMGRVDDAIQTYRKAVSLAPDYALAHWNLSLALLLAGKYREGFTELDWRWRWSGYPSPRRDFTQPQWTGDDLAGRRLLVHTEQGLGDAIHLIRYAANLAEAGVEIIVEAPAALVPLFRQSGVAGEVVAHGDVLPDFDVHAPLFDLPHLFDTTVDTIPADTPYLKASPAEDLVTHAGFRVGLCWQGNSENPAEKFRRLPLDQFAGLADINDVAWFSLQRPEELDDTIPAAFNLIDPSPVPIERATSIVAALDLVITSDTLIAHLAGALGKPVWVALPHVPDWRWGLRGDQSPWYPTARLFRQSSHGDWYGVAQQMTAALGDLVAEQ